MNEDKDQQLTTELRQAGATDAEVPTLVPLANDLRLLRYTKKARRPQIIVVPAFCLSIVLAVGAVLVILSQMSSPTSWLYPFQKISDNVGMAVHPEYRESVMTKRADQVRELVAARASTQKIIAVLGDYSEAAVDYKAVSNENYDAFKYCKTRLNQAAAQATPQVRQAIAVALQSLDTS